MGPFSPRTHAHALAGAVCVHYQRGERCGAHPAWELSINPAAKKTTSVACCSFPVVSLASHILTIVDTLMVYSQMW